eukprot:m.59136 g.59136  ORF g.59136 m.59136 type:complete len:439 (-) comp12219_c0_seq2:131-1447(-)
MREGEFFRWMFKGNCLIEHFPSKVLVNNTTKGKMARPMSYSKWDHIEVSDDEDDTHPNVDTPSLFKWRHEARLQREAEAREEKAKRQAQIKLLEEEKAKKAAALTKLAGAEDEGAAAQAKGLAAEMAELARQEAEFKKKEAELERLEKEHPHWNVDNISKDKKSRTMINKDPEPIQIDMSEFFEKYKKECRTFGMLSKPDDSQRYLREHPILVCDHLASYLIVWCVDLQVEGKTDLMERVAHQTIVAQFIMELAKSVKRDPRQCVDGFFHRLKNPEPQYMEAFQDELRALKDRIRKRAVERVAEAEAKAKAADDEERKARLGPGGLDPLEVLETLPAEIRDAFENQNTEKLRAAFQALSPKDAEYHFKRVVDSGLWVPAKGEPGAAGEGAGEGAGEAVAEEGDSSEDGEGAKKKEEDDSRQPELAAESPAQAGWCSVM